MAYDPREFATPTYQQVLKTPDRKAQRLAARFDNTRCSLKVISGYSPRLFIADVEDGTDAANPHGRPEPTPIDLTLAHYRPARQR